MLNHSWNVPRKWGTVVPFVSPKAKIFSILLIFRVGMAEES